MTKIELEIHDDTVTAISRITSLGETGVEVTIPNGSVLFDNILNLKLLKKYTEKKNINLHFVTNDPIGNNLMAMLEDQELPAANPLEKEMKPKHQLPKVRIKFPKFSFKKIPLFFGFLLIIGGGSLFIYLNKNHKATANIVVNSQPLTRSITVRVKDGSITNVEDKILEGQKVQVNIEDSQETETTGELLVGEKAKGKATLYNRTSEEKEFENGTELVYEKHKYETREDVTVPASHPEDINDPLSPMIPGEAIVEIEAKDIGEEFNVDNDETLEFDDYAKEDYIAKVTEEVDGGKSEILNIVSENDIETLKEQLWNKSKESAEQKLKNEVRKDQKAIKGSESIVITDEKYSHEIGDKTDELSLTQKVSGSVLTYNKDALNSLMDKLTEGLVPDGFILSSKERSIQVEVLGHSTNSVLTANEADIQVTLKTYVVPDIDSTKIKEDLAGKNLNEVQEILGSIRNIKTYEYRVSPKIPIFQRAPKDVNKIEVTVERK